MYIVGSSLHFVIVVQMMCIFSSPYRLAITPIIRYLLILGTAEFVALACFKPGSGMAGASRSPVIRSCIVVSRLSILFDISFTVKSANLHPHHFL